MSDEIYEKLVYDGAKHASVAAFSQAHYDHTIIVHGLAKAYSMTGWRIGLTAAPEPIAKAIDAIQSHSTSNPTSFAQKGAVAALNGPQDHIAVWLAEFANAGPTHGNGSTAFLESPASMRRAHFTCSRIFPGRDSNRWIFARACSKPKKSPPVPGVAFGADRLHPHELRDQHGEH